MISSLNPPVPPVAKADDEDGSSSSNHKDPAPRLLRLIKLVEKEMSGATYESYMEETVALMNSLIVLYSRRGLLQGNVVKAEKILSLLSQGRPASHGRKKGPDKKFCNHDFERSGTGTKGSSDLNQASETLIFAALTRILTESEEARLGRAVDSSLLLALGGELCVAMVRHIQVNRDADHPCILAEYEMLSQSAKSILGGLVFRVQLLENEIRRHSSQQGVLSAKSLERCLAMAVYLDESQHIVPVLSILRAACSIVKLFGTKLSRSVALLADLRKMAWAFLAAPNKSLQDAAGCLLASLPLAGGTDRKMPSEIWNSGIQDNLSMISIIAEKVAPMATKATKNDNLSDESSHILQQWIIFLQQDVSSDQDRAKTIITILRGLVLSYRNYLSPDLNGDAASILLELKLDVETVLELAERFLSYPMSAESLFFRTKTRLRDEAVDGGIISPRIMATQVANEIKGLGDDVLEVLINSIGGPALLPYARRIIRVSYASLLTSCSGHVRNVVDPSSAGQLDGKKRRWLHQSVTLRTRAVKTLQTVIIAFGSDRTAKVDSVQLKAESMSDGELAVRLVAGCLMEQIGARDVEESIEENWGTLDERIVLITACLGCLQAAVASANGFLGLAARSIIDSIVVTCLARNNSGFSVDPFTCSSVQTSTLRLASTCLSTPWNDGAASSVARLLKNFAQKVLNDGDEGMSLSAMEALRLCDLFGTPRAPPLVYVNRTVNDNAERFESLAPNAIAGIQIAQVENKKARVAVEEAEKNKLQEKRLRDKEREDLNKIKRARQETRHHLAVSLDAATQSAPAGQEFKAEAIPVEEQGSYMALDERRHVEVQVGHRIQTEGSADAADGSSDEARSGDENFPDIDIVADGPDSDDD